jgi:hypothetical protein
MLSIIQQGCEFPWKLLSLIMQIELNSWGNGACPFCSSAGNCHVQETLRQMLDPLAGEDDTMEMVIYSCPYFNEKD